MTGLGGFGESGPDSPSLNAITYRAENPKNGGFGPPPLFSKIGGGKKGSKKVYDRRQISACPFMASVGLKSQGGGGAMVPRVVPVGGVPPPLFRK